METTDLFRNKRKLFMKIAYEYSHLGGSEILQIRFPNILKEIYQVISKVKANKTKESKEKTSKGELFYNPADMNKQFKNLFYSLKYKELKETYTISIPNHTYQVKGGYKQIDFEKEKVLIEVQFGKYFAMFYDMAKFQYFFNESKAEVGVEIVPCHPLYRKMSSGVSYGEQLVYDIERLKRHFPAVPVKVILIAPDEFDLKKIYK